MTTDFENGIKIQPLRMIIEGRLKLNCNFSYKMK